MKNKIIFFICILLFSACKHEIESPSWTVDVVVPIAKTELKLTDLLKDSEVDLDTNSNDELLLVYRLNPIDTNLNDLFADGNLGFTKTEIIPILEFEIPDININFEASLALIIKGTPLETILVQDTTVGLSITYNIPSKDFNMDAIPNFNELEIESGFIEIKITNNLPTAIDGLSMILKNQDPNSLFPNDDIISIPNSGTIQLNMGDSTTLVDNLSNVFFTNLLQLAVGSFSFLPNPVPTTIDTASGIKFNIFIHDIVVSRIQGVIEIPIPLDSTSGETYINIQGLDITKAKIDSGSININLNTLLDMPLQLNFYSPNLVPDDTISITVTGGSGTSSIDLSGKEITFDGKNNDTINTFYYELFGFIPPTTIHYDASVNDEVEYEITVYIKPKYVIANVDEVIIEIAKDTFEFDFFKDLEVGSNFSVESAKITLGIENSIGVGCSYDLNVASENSVDGNSAFTGINNTIASASFNQFTEIVTPTYAEVEFDNIENIINIKPDLITIDGEITLNSGIDNFIVYDKGISIAPNIEVPLSFIASNLVLSDTVDIELPTEISNATLTLIIDNGYPLNTQVEVVFLDENYIELETKVHSIPSGKISGDGRIYEPTRSLMTISIAEENIENIKYVNYIASFETSSQTVYNKIYSDYTIAIQIIAKYKSTIGE
jgi:archaellin